VSTAREPGSVECRNVEIRYEHNAAPILEGLSFSVGDGERVAVVGLNGAGKTSLLLALVGLVPHTGDITICGHCLSARTAPEVRRRIGFLFNVPEDQLLFPTAVEDVAFGLIRGGAPADAARERARDSLLSLGVGHFADYPLHHLSHGQKQRIALAGAIVTDPPLLLLDEPTAGLDPRGRRDLARLLTNQAATQLIATHDLDFVDRLCSRVMLLEEGAVAVEAADTAPIRARWDSNHG
jgi:cobalt/nickel transport system ATP-binding protein